MNRFEALLDMNEHREYEEEEDVVGDDDGVKAIPEGEEAVQEEETISFADVPEHLREDVKAAEDYVNGRNGKVRDFSQVVLHLEKMKDEVPGFNYALGILHMTGGPSLKQDLIKFQHYMEKTIELDVPDYKTTAEVLLARHFLDAGKSAEGVRLLEQVIEREDNADAKATLGQFLVTNGKYAEVCGARCVGAEEILF